MGGTTAKVCLIEDGAARRWRTHVRGRARAPVQAGERAAGAGAASIELIEIGAGGGSIARVDELGLLKVGPRSAGADPGPACYGLGGDGADGDRRRPRCSATSTRDYFLGGRMPLSVDAAEEAIRTASRSRWGSRSVEAAWGIHQVVNENMTAATRIHVAERGADPRGCG